MTAWGFDYKASIVWVKDRAPGLGWFVNTKHELLLVATRGQAHPVEKVDSVFAASVGKDFDRIKVANFIGVAVRSSTHHGTCQVGVR